MRSGQVKEIKFKAFFCVDGQVVWLKNFYLRTLRDGGEGEGQDISSNKGDTYSRDQRQDFLVR